MATPRARNWVSREWQLLFLAQRRIQSVLSFVLPDALAQTMTSGSTHAMRIRDSPGEPETRLMPHSDSPLGRCFRLVERFVTVLGESCDLAQESCGRIVDTNFRHQDVTHSHTKKRKKREKSGSTQVAPTQAF